MTNKPMLSVELRALLERVATESDHMLGFTYASNYDECRKAVDELRALLDKPADKICAVCKGFGRYQDGDSGTDEDGRCPNVVDCDCDNSERMPEYRTKPAAQGHGEPVYQLRNTKLGTAWRDADLEAYASAAKLLDYERRIMYAEQPSLVSALITDEQILEAMRQSIASADGGYVVDTAPQDVIAAGRALLAEVARLNRVKP